MFCPHCGHESTGDLNYCKRCGGNLNLVALPPAQASRPPISTGTAFAVGGSVTLLVVLGFGLLMAFMSEMRGSLPPDVFKALIVFGALTILGSVVSLACLWGYLLGTPGQTTDAEQLKSKKRPDELGPASVNALPARPESSVVEHTTRTLEHSRR